MNLPLTKQVSSLELSKRLRELRCPQDSLFYWANDFRGRDRKRVWGIRYNDVRGTVNREYVSAYTVAELGVFYARFNQELPYYNRRCVVWQSMGYYDLPSGRTRIEGDTEADCRAEEIAHFIEIGRIKAEDL